MVMENNLSWHGYFCLSIALPNVEGTCDVATAAEFCRLPWRRPSPFGWAFRFHYMHQERRSVCRLVDPTTQSEFIRDRKIEKKVGMKMSKGLLHKL